MTKTDSSEQPNEDALRRKRGVLRARDIIPPYEKGTVPGQNSPRKSQDAGGSGLKLHGSSTDEVKGMPPQKKPAPGKDVRSDACRRERQGGEIPRFDLAEKILAEQRKISSAKRRAPCEKTEAPIEPVIPQSPVYVGRQPSASGGPSEQEQIITEIVARDIEKFCKPR